MNKNKILTLLNSSLVIFSFFSISLIASKTKSSQVKKKRSNQGILIDKIIVRVNIEGFKGVNILKSDLEKPRIDKEGGIYTLDETIMEELLYQKATEKHLLPTNADIERQLVAFKMQNDMSNLSDKEFENQLKESGFNKAPYPRTILDEYKAQLARVLAIENLKRAEISEKIFISSQEVEDFSKKHPAYTKEEYHLKIATLTPEQEKNYQEFIASDKISWKDLGFIAREDIDSNYSVVFSMKPGEFSKPIHSHEKINICMLVNKKEKRLQTLDERYATIEKMLQQKKREELIPAFEKELRAKATIVFS